MSNSPMCCGMPAKFVQISPRLEYFYCSECRKEVLDLPPQPDEYEGWPILTLQDIGRTIKFPDGHYIVNGFTGGLSSGAIKRGEKEEA